jgi:predicted nucleic acid-binding protein
MAAGLCKLHPVEPEDVRRGIDLFETQPGLDARDAVFAALAINRGIDAILATDRAFDEVAGLERIDPADERAVTGLGG